MKRILIVEDDALIVEVYGAHLTHEGYTVKTARDGQRGIEAVRAQRPDLVLLDLMLPGMNGVEVLQAIRADYGPRELPVIVTTNAYFGGMVQQAWEAGANQVVTKATMTPKLLTHIIQATLALSATAPQEADPGPMSQMLTALDLLLRDLRNKPERATPSVVLTIAQAIATLQFLTEQRAEAATHPPAARILVVDDDEFARSATCRALEKVNLHATCVDNPVSALKRRLGSHFDLILLDVELPEANGFDLCSRLRNAPEHQQTPIVFLTVHNSQADRKESVRRGADDFVTKPFLSSELGVKALNYVIRGRAIDSGVSPSS